MEPHEFRRMKTFIKDVFSDNGNPSCSRVTSFILSVGCLVILACLFHHLMYLTGAAISMWLPNMPYIIVAMGAFSQCPYGINSVMNIFGKLKGKADDADTGK